MRWKIPLSRHWSFRWLAVALVCGNALYVPLLGVSSDGPLVYAIKDARIVTVTGGTLAKGTVLIRDGLIESVGERVQIPPDARVLEGAGLTVYPGLIDAHAEIALEQPQQAGQRQTRPGSGQPSPPPSLENKMSPDKLAADQLKVDEATFEKYRNAGITTALTIPRRGIFIGQSALINLAGEKAAQLVVQSPVALHIGLESTGGFREYPSSLMGVISYIRQTLYDAQHYQLERQRYQATRRGMRRPEMNNALEALQPVIAGRLPVVMVAQEAKEIHRAIELAEEFKLKCIISGATESAQVAELLRAKQIPVLLSLNFPTEPRDADPEADTPVRVLRQRAEAPKAAAMLQRAGVKFAFTSGFMSDPKDFIKNAAKAVKAGLAEADALKALTINAAEIFGVAEQLGSIEAGKIANLLVTDGDLFNEKATIKYVFIDGRQFEIKKEPSRATPAGEQPPVDATGMWNLTVETPQGAVQVTANVQQSGTTLGGTISSLFGEASISSGSIRGRTVQFAASINIGGQPTKVEFDGTIQGDSINGTVSVSGQGSFPFSGTRPK
ncbi:MAG: amidohydrolase family protein [Acidobacteriota bacterium]|nr:amidohydrolase family protein [Blastocatellia bacterium]MDW8239689.1 amidohydrolase family protein [Acidobacteriota bacterium]